MKREPQAETPEPQQPVASAHTCALEFLSLEGGCQQRLRGLSTRCGWVTPLLRLSEECVILWLTSFSFCLTSDTDRSLQDVGATAGKGLWPLSDHGVESHQEHQFCAVTSLVLSHGNGHK